MGNYNADPDPNLIHARQLAFGFRLAPLPKLKIDQFSTATSAKVFTLVQFHGSTRLKVLIDPLLIPQ